MVTSRWRKAEGVKDVQDIYQFYSNDLSKQGNYDEALNPKFVP